MRFAPLKSHHTFMDDHIRYENCEFSYTIPDVLDQEDMSCLIPPSNQLGGLFLGNLEAASNTSFLRKNNIGAVLTVNQESDVCYSQD